MAIRGLSKLSETPFLPLGITTGLLMGRTDDAALVRRCLRGHADAMQALVDRFQAEVYGLCVRILTHRQSTR